jgi:hypothetical protein
MNQPPPQQPEESGPQLQRQHVYFITVDWEGDPHQPESPERVAQHLRQLIEHDHDHGPDMQPSRFSVRVKTDQGSAEVKGLAAHRHLHQHAEQPPTAE